MYLESIFIGGDIRSQLPEEAKKFDNIDRIFKRASGQNEGGRGQCESGRGLCESGQGHCQTYFLTTFKLNLVCVCVCVCLCVCVFVFAHSISATLSDTPLSP